MHIISTGQVVQQSSPDGGTTRFWYDYLGRPVISQNEEQRGNAGSGNSRIQLYSCMNLYLDVLQVGENSGSSVNPIEHPGYFTSAQLQNQLGVE